jgi:methyltransferase (TIGR00027 family)
MSLPSRTSQAVALTRALLDRPHSPAGDPDAQRALCEGMGFVPPAWLRPSIAARTEFVDAEVTSAIAAGVQQIVVCGAGYDDRALRFRTDGVRFFELDHPGTQADKARRLRAMGVVAGGASAGPGLTLASADFRTDDVAAVLAGCGHELTRPSLFICEGLLVYLDQAVSHSLLSGLAACAAPGSVLAASLSTHDRGHESAEVLAAANARRRTAVAEPWRTILPAEEYLAVLAAAGWRATARLWAPASGSDVSYERRSLLVTAEPAEPAAQ